MEHQTYEQRDWETSLLTITPQEDTFFRVLIFRDKEVPSPFHQHQHQH